VSAFTVRLNFHDDLGFFLRSPGAVERQLFERTSVKDLIEACGVPHTEVDLIVVDGEPVDFGHALGQNASVEIYPIDWKRGTFFPKNRLQTIEIQQFVADGHLGKLARDLRLLGLDVLYERTAEDRQLLELAKIDNPEKVGAHEVIRSRALLTRDRRLLMHAVVRHGYYVRSQNPLDQTIEVLRRFALSAALAPFTRCLACNAPLEPVEKADVFDQLEPLTKIYYERFRRCGGCGQIYWQGSHFDKLQARVEEVRAAMGLGAQAKSKP
jgi:uncharacterized protein with PIN domain